MTCSHLYILVLGLCVKYEYVSFIKLFHGTKFLVRIIIVFCNLEIILEYTWSLRKELVKMIISSLRESSSNFQLVYTCESVVVLILLCNKAGLNYLNLRVNFSCFSILLPMLLCFIIQHCFKLDIDAVERWF